MAGRNGRRFKTALSQIDRRAQYSIEDAVTLLKDMPAPKFDQTVEMAMRLGVDPRQADQQVRGTVMLPHGLGKTIRVVVFAKGEQAAAAEGAGADVVGADDLAERINGGWTDFRRRHRGAGHDEGCRTFGKDTRPPRADAQSQERHGHAGRGAGGGGGQGGSRGVSGRPEWKRPRARGQGLVREEPIG